MASWLIAFTGAIYAVVAADLFRKGQTGPGIAFLGYAFSNIGLWLAATR